MKYIFLVLLLMSCSHKKPFYEDGRFGEKKIDDETYLVSFHGSPHATDQTVQEMLYLRCSEIALKQGYPYFIVIGGNWQRENEYMNHIFKISDKLTLTNKIKLSLSPVPGQTNFDAKAIFTKRMKLIESEN